LLFFVQQTQSLGLLKHAIGKTKITLTEKLVLDQQGVLPVVVGQTISHGIT